jgi:hypothetical protein
LLLFSIFFGLLPNMLSVQEYTVMSETRKEE